MKDHGKKEPVKGATLSLKEMATANFTLKWGSSVKEVHFINACRDILYKLTQQPVQEIQNVTGLISIEEAAIVIQYILSKGDASQDVPYNRGLRGVGTVCYSLKAIEGLEVIDMQDIPETREENIPSIISVPQGQIEDGPGGDEGPPGFRGPAVFNRIITEGILQQCMEIDLSPVENERAMVLENGMLLQKADYNNSYNQQPQRQKIPNQTSSSNQCVAARE